MKFGYLSSNVEGAGALRTEDSLKEALRNLQRFANMPRLPVTGEMDERTMELMSMPRCGVRDFDPATGSPATSYSGAIRRKRYVLHTGNPWQHKDLTWR
ncbi:putative peptidoglycan binding domain [Popillia japonica]|uniref:Peptidoglycan binding domain n=1 Tax=Popillia japonica TaxID=7064 RepID=A0AAW1MZP1_POPJA